VNKYINFPVNNIIVSQPERERESGPPAPPDTVVNPPTCIICNQRPRNTIFTCGHGACAERAEGITQCHICRAQITHRIQVYQ